MQYDQNGLEVLVHDECIELLRSSSFGRIGLLVDGLPVVLPVNYSVQDQELIIRTVRGTKLAAATRNAIVAFEVDRQGPHDDEGWSVMVRGVARELGPSDLGRPMPKVTGWLADRDVRFVTISLDLVSGRRLTPAAQHQPLSSSVL